jgi:peptidoglycan/xylan/chitin deacetylase (PgdA/CDA1 family)
VRRLGIAVLIAGSVGGVAGCGARSVRTRVVVTRPARAIGTRPALTVVPAPVRITVPPLARPERPVPARLVPARTAPPPLAVAPVGTSGVVDHGSRTRPWVALTFDADMTRPMLARLRAGRVRSWYDASVIAELRATRTPATIFLTGLWVETYPDVVRALSRDPLFELENHSMDHAGWLAPCFGLPPVPGAPSAKAREVTEAAATIKAVAGRSPAYFRFPGGCHSPVDARQVLALGEVPIGWDVVSGDAYQLDPAVIVHDVLSSVRPGSIIVMHLIGAPNAPAMGRALPVIIRTLRARGLRLVTLSRLLGGR